jgi:hypothetical protein
MSHLRDRRAFGNIGTRKFRGARFGDALSPRSVITPVTDGMTLTAAWTVRGTNYYELAAAQSASVRVDATIDSSDSGILMEAGASASGLIFYVHGGKIYFQCGTGNAAGTMSNRAETSYTLPVGEFDYVVEWSADTSNNVLYVNGVLVDSQTYNHNQIAGTDEGTIGRVAGALARNQAGWTLSTQGEYPNVITRCDVFAGQVTADV